MYKTTYVHTYLCRCIGALLYEKKNIKKNNNCKLHPLVSCGKKSSTYYILLFVILYTGNNLIPFLIKNIKKHARITYFRFNLIQNYLKRGKWNWIIYNEQLSQHIFTTLTLVQEKSQKLCKKNHTELHHFFHCIHLILFAALCTWCCNAEQDLHNDKNKKLQSKVIINLNY